MRVMVSAVTTFVVAIGLSVVFASSAQAYTSGEYSNYHGGNLCSMRGYVDYNWLEESWAGGSNRDYTWHKYYYNCYYPGIIKVY